ncbi:MAG: M48 family metalloprotease [Candidatus Methanoperedens sp.]
MLPDTTATERQLKGIVDIFLSRLSIKTSLVLVKITDDSNISVGGARGLTMWRLPMLGNTAIGEIFLNREWLDRLSQSELEYVLSHEVAHIYYSHVFTTTTIQLVKTIINKLANEKSDVANLVKGLSILKNLIDLWVFRMHRQLPFEVALRKEQEIAADALAIKYLTKNKMAAISFLRRYVNDDLTRSSHIWEVLDIELPVMTMQERINEINNVKDITTQINGIRIDHNIWLNGYNGMVIHVDFNVQNLMWQRGMVVAYFNYWNGDPLCDFDSQYRTDDGHVSVGIEFIPRFDDTNYHDFILFMPYSQLHMATGNFDLMFQVKIWDMNIVPRKIVNSEWIRFAGSMLN